MKLQIGEIADIGGIKKRHSIPEKATEIARERGRERTDMDGFLECLPCERRLNITL